MSTSPDDCVFCWIARVDPKGQVLRRIEDVIVFEPLNPVTPGHLLVVPSQHLRDAADDPEVTGRVFRQAAHEARRSRPCNLITSVGAEATQSVFHLHVHVVPRRAMDGLKLPWSDPGTEVRSTV